jgi:chemotaxis protein MotA
MVGGFLVMDLATIIGLVTALLVISVVMILDGGSPLDLLSRPQAVLLIFGGSMAATMVTVSLKTVMKVPVFIKQAMTENKFSAKESIDLLVKMADRARRDGLLALEEETKKVKDSFLQKGLMMVVDGVDSNQLREVLEITIEETKNRHKVGIGFFASAGGFAPTFGIIGTVMGLISVLQKLDDPSSFTKSIASAFLATLWGLLFANVIYLPISGKLKGKSEEEIHLRYMQLDGILAIQAGENPRIVREKLNAYLSPADLKAMGQGQSKDVKARQPAGSVQSTKA